MSLLINALENDEILTSNNFAKNSDIVFSEVVTKNYFEKIRNEKTRIIEETNLYVFYVLTEFELHENSIIFTNTYLLRALFDLIRDSKFKNLKIITSQTDHSINKKLFRFKPHSVSRWYSTNVNYENSKLIPIPLGLANGYSPKNLNKKNYANLQKEKNKIEKIYINFEQNTNYFHRIKLKKKLRNKDFVFIENKKLTLEKYINDLSSYKFILCPWGNGLDSHRIWESLYAGSKPIIPFHNSLMKILKDNSVFFKKISEINNLIISNKNDDVQKHQEILNINYWIDLIRNNEAVVNQNSESIQSDYEEVILNYRKMKSKEDSQKKLYTFVRKLHNKIFNIFINILKIYT